MNSRLAALSVLCRKRNINARQNPALAVHVSVPPVRRSCSRHIAALVLAGSLGAANPAHAEMGNLYSTNFEPPKFLGGEQLAGVGRVDYCDTGFPQSDGCEDHGGGGAAR